MSCLGTAKGLCQSWVSRRHPVRGAKEAGLWQGLGGGCWWGAQLWLSCSGRDHGMLEGKEERWAVDKDWEMETNCSSFVFSMLQPH